MRDIFGYALYEAQRGQDHPAAKCLRVNRTIRIATVVVVRPLSSLFFRFLSLPGFGPPRLGYTAYFSDEKYRYDALGRRVYTHVVRGPNCHQQDISSGCRSALTRTVWDGGQVLYEIRVPGDTSAGPALEHDTDPSDAYNGQVGYVHAGGIDKLLALWKNGGELVFPQSNWRGVYIQGSCIQAPNPASQCSDVWFPGASADLFGENSLPNGPPSWRGSILESSQDASGYQYRRNRYYDPHTGRFTQEDPIGLAGGLNLYGFAGGDPVNYSDPFGLCPLGNCTQSQRHYTLDAAGTRFIQQHEGTVLHTYIDAAGNPTIGTGHLLGGESYPNGITADQAATLFQNDLGIVVQPSLDQINNPSLGQNQVNAVGDFIFNEGQTRFANYVLPSLNSDNLAGATGHMANFTKSRRDGKLVTDPVLVNRRRDELKLFNTGEQR